MLFLFKQIIKIKDMKLKYIIFAITGLVLVSCKSEQKPEEVVKEFFAAIDAKDFAKAKTLATNESSSMIKMMEKAADFAPEDEEGKSSVDKVECVTEGDKGDCKCSDAAGENEQNVSVKKVDGQWKVHMTKQEMMNDAMEKAGSEVNMDEAMDALKDIDMEKAMETFSEEIDSLGKSMESINGELKGKTIEAIDAIEENLDEVKESLKE